MIKRQAAITHDCAFLVEILSFITYGVTWLPLIERVELWQIYVKISINYKKIIKTFKKPLH